jgi:cytochrome c553
LICLVIATLSLSANVVFAADADAVQMAKNLCAGCHGPQGVSTNELWPNLAGQKAGYTAKQLRAYRDGTRTDPNMSGLSMTLTDELIDHLAAYYAGME